MPNLPSMRSLGAAAGLALVFGVGGLLFVGALDKAQTGSPASVLDPAALFGFVAHFVREAFGVLLTYHDHAGTPYHTYLVQGIARTLEFCFLALPMALVLGLGLALMSRSRHRIVRLPARAYVEFFRDTPLLVQLLAIYWALIFLPKDIVTAFTAGLATLVLNYAAYECENLRAGIEALDSGQGEAAAVLGLSAWQSLRLIILPQMISIALPPVLNDLIYLYKDSAVLSLITIAELTSQATNLSRRAPNLSWQFFLWVGVGYLALSVPLSRVARAAEHRLKTVGMAPRSDLALTALVVIGVMAAIGWLCGVALDGFSLTTLINHLAELLAALALTLGLMIAALTVLGAIVYLPASAIAAVRRRATGGHPRDEAHKAAAISR